MVQPLLRRRIHRGLVSISPCGTAGAGLRLAAPVGQERCTRTASGPRRAQWAIADAVRSAGMVLPHSADPGSDFVAEHGSVAT